ncbi:hypothetical protein [Aeromicrobium sp. Root344]|uniref:hypothetical protein n=1 Tax=Aeromicrobium sp. Root344 TaxID=1736521 RepID=UPI0009EA6930|nr:hypothetical protein [Aeromicrobium sp. Root344]
MLLVDHDAVIVVSDGAGRRIVIDAPSLAQAQNGSTQSCAGTYDQCAERVAHRPGQPTDDQPVASAIAPSSASENDWQSTHALQSIEAFGQQLVDDAARRADVTHALGRLSFAISVDPRFKPSRAAA